MAGQPRIVVVGLGYVGLPLAIALARKFDVIGLDVDSSRIAELRSGDDRTREVEPGALSASSITLASTCAMAPPPHSPAPGSDCG